MVLQPIAVKPGKRCRSTSLSSRPNPSYVFPIRISTYFLADQQDFEVSFYVHGARNTLSKELIKMNFNKTILLSQELTAIKRLLLCKC